MVWLVSSGKWKVPLGYVHTWSSSRAYYPRSCARARYSLDRWALMWTHPFSSSHTRIQVQCQCLSPMSRPCTEVRQQSGCYVPRVCPHIFVGSKAIYCFAHPFRVTPIFFKIASDRMKWSKYVRRKVWTHHHFVLVPMHWYSGTTCEQALGLKKMKATGAEADRLITKGRDLSGVFPVELTEEANTEKNRIPSLFLVVSYYLKPKLLHAKTP